MTEDVERRETSSQTTSPSPAAAETACRDVVTSVYGAIDAGRASDAVVSYTEDAVFETARGGRMEGIEAIAAVLAKRQADAGRVTRHVLTDLAVTVTGTDGTGQATEAALTGRLTVFLLSGPSPDEPELTTALDIGLSQRAGTWRISRHRSTRIAEGDAR